MGGRVGSRTRHDIVNYSGGSPVASKRPARCQHLSLSLSLSHGEGNLGQAVCNYEW